jgi:MFS family permease
MLIVGRAIAGSGGAGLYSGGMTMLAYAIPLKQRTIYLACLSSMFGIAAIVGPILGGVFTDQLTWRWCFWINLPFGGLTIVTVAGFFKSPKRDFSHITFKQKIKEMDLIGATFLIGAIVCLLLALQWGGSYLLRTKIMNIADLYYRAPSFVILYRHKSAPCISKLFESVSSTDPDLRPCFILKQIGIRFNVCG